MDHPGYGDFRARREATVWQRLNSVLRVLLVLALVLVIVSLFLPQSKKLTQSRAEIDKLQGLVNEQKDSARPANARSESLENGSDLSGNDGARSARFDEGRRNDFPPRAVAGAEAELSVERRCGEAHDAHRLATQRRFGAKRSQGNDLSASFTRREPGLNCTWHRIWIASLKRCPTI